MDWKRKAYLPTEDRRVNGPAEWSELRRRLRDMQAETQVRISKTIHDLARVSRSRRAQYLPSVESASTSRNYYHEKSVFPTEVLKVNYKKERKNRISRCIFSEELENKYNQFNNIVGEAVFDKSSDEIFQEPIYFGGPTYDSEVDESYDVYVRKDGRLSDVKGTETSKGCESYGGQARGAFDLLYEKNQRQESNYVCNSKTEFQAFEKKKQIIVPGNLHGIGIYIDKDANHNAFKEKDSGLIEVGVIDNTKPLLLPRQGGIIRENGYVRCKTKQKEHDITGSNSKTESSNCAFGKEQPVLVSNPLQGSHIYLACFQRRINREPPDRVWSQNLFLKEDETNNDKFMVHDIVATSMLLVPHIVYRKETKIGVLKKGQTEEVVEWLVAWKEKLATRQDYMIFGFHEVHTLLLTKIDLRSYIPNPPCSETFFRSLASQFGDSVCDVLVGRSLSPCVWLLRVYKTEWNLSHALKQVVLLLSFTVPLQSQFHYKAFKTNICWSEVSCESSKMGYVILTFNRLPQSKSNHLHGNTIVLENIIDCLTNNHVPLVHGPIDSTKRFGISCNENQDDHYSVNIKREVAVMFELDQNCVTLSSVHCYGFNFCAPQAWIGDIWIKDRGDNLGLKALMDAIVTEFTCVLVVLFLHIHKLVGQSVELRVHKTTSRPDVKVAVYCICIHIHIDFQPP